MANTQARKRRGTQHASAETRLSELLGAAEICFGRNGYVATTIDHIAEQAGLSKGSVYRFFDSKDDILIAILDRYEQEILDRIARATSPGAPHLEQIRMSQRTTVEVLSSVPELIRVWREFQHHPQAKKRIAELFAAARANLDHLVKSGIAAGSMRDQPLQAVVDMLMAFNEGILVLAEADTGFEPLERFDSAWPLIERGLV